MRDLFTFETPSSLWWWSLVKQEMLLSLKLFILYLFPKAFHYDIACVWKKFNIFHVCSFIDLVWRKKKFFIEFYVFLRKAYVNCMKNTKWQFRSHQLQFTFSEKKIENFRLKFIPTLLGISTRCSFDTPNNLNCFLYFLRKTIYLFSFSLFCFIFPFLLFGLKFILSITEQ